MDWKLPTAPRILLVRLSAIGDVIHTLPVLCALRERFPAAHITWVVEERSAALLVGHPALDELIALPHGFLRSPGVLWNLIRRLRAGRYDLAIDAQGLSKSAIVARLSGTPRRIGFGRPWGREISRLLNTICVPTERQHAVDRNLELLRPLGMEHATVRFDVPERPSDRATAERWIADARLERGFACIGPGAGWPSKLWPVERFAAVADHLGRAWQVPCLVIWGNARERQWAEEIADDLPMAADGPRGVRGHVAPKMSLAELAAVLRRAKFYLGGDSGPLHLAAAVGTPCIGLYGPWPADKHGPYGPHHIVLQKRVCHGSTRTRRRASSEYMQAITVDDVSRACDQMLGGSESRVA